MIYAMINSLRLRAQDAQSKVILLLIVGVAIGVRGANEPTRGVLKLLDNHRVQRSSSNVNIQVNSEDITIKMCNGWTFQYYTDPDILVAKNEKRKKAEQPIFATEWKAHANKTDFFEHDVKVLRVDVVESSRDHRIYEMRFSANMQITEDIMEALGRKMPGNDLVSTNTFILQDLKESKAIKTRASECEQRWIAEKSLIQIGDKDLSNVAIDFEIDFVPSNTFSGVKMATFVMRVAHASTNNWLYQCGSQSWATTQHESGKDLHTLNVMNVSDADFNVQTTVSFLTDKETTRQMMEQRMKSLIASGASKRRNRKSKMRRLINLENGF